MGGWRGLILLVVGCHTPAPLPPKSCVPGPITLTIPWVPPSVGETLHFTDRVTIKGIARGKSLDTAADFETREVVREVTDDIISDLEINFVRGLATGATAGDLTGFVVHAHAGAEATAFAIDGQPATDVQVPLLRLYHRDDVGAPYWPQRVLAEQTFIAGAETLLTPEGTIGSGARSSTLGITLRSVHGGIAELTVIETPSIGGRIEHHLAIETTRGRLVSNTSHGVVDIGRSHLVVDEDDRFEYERPPPAPNPIASCDAPRTLHVPWQAPKVGETSKVHEVSVYDVTGTAKHIRVAAEFDSVDRVLAVAAGMIADKESRVTRGRLESPLAKPIDFTGDVIRARVTDKQPLFTRNDRPVAKGDLVAGAILRSDVYAREWTMRVVTDRSYEEGVEQHFPHEPIGIFGPGMSDLRVMLVGIDGHHATFKLTIKSTVTLGDASMIMRVTGRLVLDTANARVIALDLHGRPEMKGIVDGSYELTRTIAY